MLHHIATISVCYGGHFESKMTAKIQKFLCQVSKGSAVWSEFNIFCTFVTMAMATILNFFNPSKAATHYGGYSYKVSRSLMKGIQNFFHCHGNKGAKNVKFTPNSRSF
jgi:hypothetical protein